MVGSTLYSNDPRQTFTKDDVPSEISAYFDCSGSISRSGKYFSALRKLINQFQIDRHILWDNYADVVKSSSFEEWINSKDGFYETCLSSFVSFLRNSDKFKNDFKLTFFSFT